MHTEFAHGAGKDRDYADMVRDAWHFFEHGRRYAELPVERYRIEYRDPEPPPPRDDDRRIVDDEEFVHGRRTGRDLDTFQDPDTGEWVTQEELHRRQNRRAAAGVETMKPALLNDDPQTEKKEDAPAAPEREQDLETRKKRPGAATALDAFDDEEVLF